MQSDFSSSTRKLYLILILFTSLLNSVDCQVGGEVGYVLAPNKEGFAARLYGGTVYGDFRIGLGFELGEFIANPTGRVLPYYSVKLGADYDLNAFNDFPLYFGLDFEFLKSTRIINEQRISIFPKVGSRLFNVLFLEVSADNLNEPGEEKRLFDIRINAFRVILGFNHYFGY